MAAKSPDESRRTTVDAVAAVAVVAPSSKSALRLLILSVVGITRAGPEDTCEII